VSDLAATASGQSLTASSGQALGSATATRTAEAATATRTRVRREAAPYASPYLAGFGVGVVLLLAFVLVGRGLGASGAFSSVVTAAVETTAPTHAAGNEFYARYLSDGGSPLSDWLVFEIIGVIVGGVASGFLAGRIRWTTERGPGITDRRRLINAFVGGVTMGIGAKLARGCTSGLGLTGGATLSVGSWLFVIAAFAGAYAAAPLLRRAWR
jgi:uncharacterized membrane protein YedE/YeeE